MRRSMESLRDRLSSEIFSRRFVELDETQQTFVDYHVAGHNTYVTKVVPIVRWALARNLKKEYDTILDMYCLRLPPEYFRAAVEEGVKKAKDREAITYAAGWFKDHFRRHSERYRKHVSQAITGRIDVDVDWPWFFNIFRYIRENDTDLIFDPFWGSRERKKRKKRKKSDEEELRELQQIMEGNILLIETIQKWLKKTNLNIQTKKKLLKQLKYRKRKQKKIIEQFNMLEQLIKLDKEWEGKNAE